MIFLEQSITLKAELIEGLQKMYYSPHHINVQCTVFQHRTKVWQCYLQIISFMVLPSLNNSLRRTDDKSPDSQKVQNRCVCQFSFWYTRMNIWIHQNAISMGGFPIKVPQWATIWRFLLAMISQYLVAEPAWLWGCKVQIRKGTESGLVSGETGVSSQTSNSDFVWIMHSWRIQILRMVIVQNMHNMQTSYLS